MNSSWSLSWGDRTSVCDSQESVWSTRLNTRGSFVSIGHSATHIAASAQLPSRLQRASCIDCMLFQLLLALSARHGLFCDFCRHMSTHALRKIHFKKKLITVVVWTGKKSSIIIISYISRCQKHKQCIGKTIELTVRTDWQQSGN